jgi:thiol-disulfide isomerase/thioredoxin
VTKSHKIILLLIIVVTFILAILYAYLKTTQTTSTFTFKDLNAETFTIKTETNKFQIDKMQNKIVLLKTFGWDCPYCLKEIPQLIKLQEEFDGLLDIIAIESQKSSMEENKKQAKALNINYHIVSGNGHDDFYKYLKKNYNWEGIIPLTIILNQKGKVLAFERGVKSYSLAEILKKSLSKEETK